MATTAPLQAQTSWVAAPPGANGDVPWVISGVAAELARRLRASVTFIRVLLLLAAYAWFWPMIGVYAVAALLVPRSGRRRPGWQNLVALSRVALVLLVPLAIPVISNQPGGLWGQGPWVWIPFAGAALAGIVALFTSGRAATQYEAERCRHMVIASVPAVVLSVTIAAGMVLAPGVRWELVLEVGLIALAAFIVVAGWRAERHAPVVSSVLLALVALVLACAGARLQGGVGDTYVKPTNLASLGHLYRRAAGDVTLNLSALHRGTAIVNTSIGFGNLTIDLPNDAAGTVDVRVGIGAVTPVSFGASEEHSGFDVHRIDRVAPVDDDGGGASRSRLHVRLSVEVGRGCVSILQIPGESIDNGSGCLG